MSKYYLRIEGVNLTNFVYDTQDLSTIRGGGLRLLDAIEEIEDRFKNKLHPISTGASSGLFEANVSTFDDAQHVKGQVKDYLNKDSCLKYATFVVDILKSNDSNFKEDKEKILALNRWSQMQSPSVAVPSQTSDTPCTIDMVRPAGSNRLPKYKDKEDVPVSDSVYYRRDYGLKAKQRFYEKITGITTLPEFVYDLDKLTSDESQGNLHHKMAVIYIDGNRFGAIQEETKVQDELKSWDDTIKQYRKQMLGELLNETILKPEWTNGDKHRMETLLWGGDEIIWVVPAWVGWWTLDFFYRHSKSWRFNGTPLKHAAGIVFCHHNAPIHRITPLAKELAEEAKKKDRSKSLFVYQKLESFDHIGKDFKSHVSSVYKGKAKADDLILDGEQMQKIRAQIIELKENDFPVSRLHKVVYAVISGQEDIESIIKKTITDKALTEQLKSLTTLLNGESTKWIHIAELWDYII